MKISKHLFNTVWLAAVVLCVFASLFCLFFSSCAAPAEKEEGEEGGFTVTNAAGQAEGSGGISFSSTGPEQAQTSGAEGAEAEAGGGEAGAAGSPVRLGLTEDAGREYLDRIIFLGDSTTNGIGYYYERGYPELCPPSQIWTPASGTLTLSYYATATIVYPETGEELTIAEAAARAKPDILLITLGVNGVSFMDEAWFKRDYTALVDSVREASPDTKIILNSIYPVMSTYQYINEISNEKIRAANGWIEDIAASAGVRFLYSYEAVAGEDGSLPAEYCNGDGIHLSGEGLTEVMHYIRTHAYL